MIIKAYDVILYDGTKLHYEVVGSRRQTDLKPREMEDRILNILSNELDKSNPPCRCKFTFG
jgi:hypothetical protein